MLTDDGTDWLNALLKVKRALDTFYQNKRLTYKKKKRSEFSDLWNRQYSDRLGRYGYQSLGDLKGLMNPAR